MARHEVKAPKTIVCKVVDQLRSRGNSRIREESTFIQVSTYQGNQRT